MTSAGRDTSPIDRYVLCEELASGGMATVHLGQFVGPVGFARTVAIKRLHAHFARDPEFVSMFLDEARLAARIRHPNVVSTLDVVARAGELFLVMDYVHGESLSKLLCAATSGGQRIPLPIVVGVMAGVLYGLEAAHEARDERGNPLRVIHRDVSPQNILVDRDGVPRILDFGVARAAWRVHTTRDGQLKGKLGYMAPEQLRGEPIDRRVDIFAAAVVLWEMLVGERLFDGDAPNVYAARMIGTTVPSARAIAPEIPAALDAAVMRGLSYARDDRFPTARAMAIALENAAPIASAREIGEWVDRTVGSDLAERAARIVEIESTPRHSQEPITSHIAIRVREADARDERSRMATEVSLSRLAPETVTEKIEHFEAAPSTRRTSGAGKITKLAVGALVAALGAVWLSTWLVGSRAKSAPAQAVLPADTGEAPLSTAPAPAMSMFSAGEAPITSAPIEPSANPPTTTATPNRRLTAVHAAPQDRPAPRATVSASATASAHPNLCMKHRADGVVYFDPCP